MKTIWKWPLPTGPSEFTISMPQTAHVLCVQVQRQIPHIWAVVDPEEKREDRVFYTYATGQEGLPDLSYDRGYYVGTYQTHGGTYVWHVFAK